MNNRGRIQAQGDGLEKSEAWDTDDNVTKIDGINMADALERQLTQQELLLRDRAMQKVRNLINATPPNGLYAQIIKSYYNSRQTREVRVDLEVRKGVAFMDNPLNII